MSDGLQPNLGHMLSGLLGAKGGGSDSVNTENLAKMLPAVLGIVSAGGGLGALVERLKAGGLGEHAKSWVSPTAQNAPVSAQQITDALGSEQIDKVARQAGVSPEEAARGIASVLPSAVDQLTPAGEVPSNVPHFDVGQLEQHITKLLASHH